MMTLVVMMMRLVERCGTAAERHVGVVTDCFQRKRLKTHLFSRSFSSLLYTMEYRRSYFVTSNKIGCTFFTYTNFLRITKVRCILT